MGGAGFAAAGVAALGLRGEGISRRHLLRTSLQAMALLAVPSGLGFSLSSEVFVSGELAAYDRLEAQLSRVEQARFAPSDTTPA